MRLKISKSESIQKEISRLDIEGWLAGITQGEWVVAGKYGDMILASGRHPVADLYKSNDCFATNLDAIVHLPEILRYALTYKAPQVVTLARRYTKQGGTHKLVEKRLFRDKDSLQDYIESWHNPVAGKQVCFIETEEYEEVC